MPAPETLRVVYDRVVPVLEELQAYVSATLRPYCDAQRYIFFDRVKQLESLSEKLEGGRYASWSDIDDLYACTIVVPTPQHEEQVKKKLRDCFDQVRVRAKASVPKPPDVFRFDGLRWYGRMRPDAAAERQPGIGEVVFEVQVPTAFEYAWSTVTHDLVYKSDDADWKRLRLAAQLKATVEQIELMILAFDAASSAIRQSPWPETKAKQQVIREFSRLVDEGLIPETLRPASWSRFADNFLSLVKTYERNTRELPRATKSLLEAIVRELRDPEFAGLPYSGTLFQYVISFVARADTPGLLDDFTVVDSTELSTFYQLTEVKKPFLYSSNEGTEDPPAELPSRLPSTRPPGERAAARPATSSGP